MEMSVQVRGVAVANLGSPSSWVTTSVLLFAERAQLTALQLAALSRFFSDAALELGTHATQRLAEIFRDVAVARTNVAPRRVLIDRLADASYNGPRDLQGFASLCRSVGILPIQLAGLAMLFDRDSKRGNSLSLTREDIGRVKLGFADAATLLQLG